MVQQSIFDKVDLTVLSEELPPWAREASPERLAKRKRRKRLTFILDLIGSAVWFYAFVKLFIFDVDRFIAESISPEAVQYLNYRIVAFLVVLSIASIVFRRYWIGIIYILFYPLVVLFWKIPKIVYRARSWVVFLGVLNFVASLFRDFKFNLISKTVAVIAVLVALYSSHGAVAAFCVAVLFVVLVWVAFRTVKFSLTPSRFLSLQQKFIERTSDGDSIKEIAEIKPELRDANVEKFDKSQFTSFHMALSVAVLYHKGAYFWAYQLERYRQSATLHIFGLVSYLWLFLQAVAVFALANYTLLRFIPSAFKFEERPSWLKVVWYSLSSLFVNGIDGLSPRSDSAIGVTISAGIAGPFILAVLVLHFVQSVRQSRQDSEIRTTIGAMKDVARKLDDRLKLEYGVDANEAYDRLQGYGRNLISGVIEFVALRVPQDFVTSGSGGPRDNSQSSSQDS